MNDLDQCDICEDYNRIIWVDDDKYCEKCLKEVWGIE